MGDLYAYKGKREKALENLKKAQSMFQEMEMDYLLVRTRELLGKLQTAARLFVFKSKAPCACRQGF